MRTVEEKIISLKKLLGTQIVGEVILKAMQHDRFPVTNHYDVARSVLRKNNNGESFSRGDVSQLFNETLAEDVREAQHLVGALVHEFTFNSDDILAEILESNDPAVVDFYKKAKSATEIFWANNVAGVKPSEYAY